MNPRNPYRRDPNGPPLERVKQQEEYPVSAAQVRERTLIAAGYTPEEVGGMMRLATNRLLEQLDATRTRHFAAFGRITDSAIVEDNQARIAAAGKLIELGIDVMALKSRGGPDHQDPPKVTIDLSGWTVQPGPISGTEKASNGEVKP